MFLTVSFAFTTGLGAAAGLGLGAVWTGVHPDAGRETGFRQLLGPPNLQVARKDIFLEERMHVN
jgi:hypothetical protein